MLSAGWILVGMISGFAVLSACRVPLPLNLILVAIAGALLGGFGIPFRHLVEGGFGYLNLILALFAGAFFGQAMQMIGATDRLARMIGASSSRWVALSASGGLLFVTGMVTGIAGLAVLAVGAFAAPMLRGAGLSGVAAAAYIALMATLGMVAPPINVPAMIMADGVNMPYAGFSWSLLALSMPTALFALATFARGARQTDMASPAVDNDQAKSGSAAIGILVLFAIIVFWIALRIWPDSIFDPSTPLVLAVGGLIGLLLLKPSRWKEVFQPIFTGTPLVLAAVLVAVGVVVQIMALTGVRGWLVIQAMSFHPPTLYAAIAGIPILGSVLTSMGTANSLGVPFAFAFIHQDMILNISALSAIAALSEFCPPTAISAALAAYVVGENRVMPIIRAAIPTLIVLTILALALLILNPIVAPFLR